MSTLIPVHAAGSILDGITEYLTTSFSLAEKETSASLKSFLTDANNGMFHGPYVRVRLPYTQVKKESGDEGNNGIKWGLNWVPSWFTPYHHQAESFARLSSISQRPQPTIVITGTGSGKTESFLYPILDHCLRERKQGKTGIKALLLYPMNALANDQANRLAKLIHNDPELGGIVTAGIYTGEATGKATKMSETSLITDRETLRNSPPDILITNYKMLDQLLLRPADRLMWERSATSLQYLALDEFHTYDGAQGTDVALLLRRLGLMLKKHQPEGFLSTEEQDRPLGRVTPVATSATLGSKDDFQPVLSFAETIFGETFTSDNIVRENILSIADWQDEARAKCGAPSYPDGFEVGLPDVETIDEVLSAARELDFATHSDEYSAAIHHILCEKIWMCPDELNAALANYSVHPLTTTLLEIASSAQPLTRREADLADDDNARVLIDEVLTPAVVRQIGEDNAAEFLSHVLTSMSHLRALAGAEFGWEGKRFPGVETHMWVREVSRIERAITSEDGNIFRWGDDGPSEATEDTNTWLPACYCRNCGRSGWMAMLEPGSDSHLVLDAGSIRRGSLQAAERQRPLIDATNEQRAALKQKRELTELRGADSGSAVVWLHSENEELSTRTPTEAEEVSGLSLPVLTYTGPDAEDHAKKQICPSCGEADTIRYIGSSVATLLSVALSNLFGMPELDADQKKTLIFTDTVQDAAHRAGFVQARSRTFSLRNRAKFALNGEAVSLAELPVRILRQAKSNRERYELLPPEIADYPQFKPFWETQATEEERREASRETQRRLGFDLSLEFGQRVDLARSLAMTGSVAVMVDANSAALLSAAKAALEKAPQLTFDAADDANLLAWSRGVVEMIRHRGGIYHEWLASYIADTCNPYKLNRRYSRAKGIPGFPKGGAPEFPRVKGKTTSNTDEGTSPVASPRGRYAKWTSRVLGLNTQDAALVACELMKQLAMREILTVHRTDSSGALIYSISPERVLVSTEADPHALECSVCRSRTVVPSAIRETLEARPCFNHGCTGTLHVVALEDNYYRTLYTSQVPRTVVSREHTSLLPNKYRLELENSFRSSGEITNPDAPNVLVATPTLEMGIDIGDLSTVMLASLPTSVASYVQRVGRAGRLTGNSLVLALVRGRGVTLPKLYKPLSVINGDVTPPVAFLSAVEILRRQFAAYLLDSLPLDTLRPELATAFDVFSTTGTHPDLISVLKSQIKSGINEQLEEFLIAVSGSISSATADELRAWATHNGEDSLTGALTKAQEDWSRERTVLGARLKTLVDRLDILDKLKTNEDEEQEQERKATLASKRMISRQLSETVNNQHWIAAMERFGLLPNFTLLDDSVELSVSVSYMDPNTMQFNTEAFEYTRGVSTALRELAPGATFYARGIAATIDAVDIGTKGDLIEKWRVCPACSYSEQVIDGSTAKDCPACKNSAFADRSSLYEVVPMRKVSAEVEKTRSTISDRIDERYSSHFHLVTSYRVPDNGHGKAWWISNGFGVDYLRSVELRWLNFGKGHGPKKVIAGNEVEAPLFHVCRHCGHVDSEAGTNSRWDHRPWCQHRHEQKEDTVSFALGRTLKTQGVLLYLPDGMVFEDNLVIPSLMAAIRLGFKEYLGGDPEHLRVINVKVPGMNGDGDPIDALMLHDEVPGGTGYLYQFSDPTHMRNLLVKAFEKVTSCECQQDERSMCPDCLLPYASPFQLGTTNRAAAARVLAAILTDTSRYTEELDPLTSEWTTLEERPAMDDTSYLEYRFRKLLRQTLKDRKVEITDTDMDGARRTIFKFPSGAQWVMTEQKDFRYTRPDFYFERLKANSQPIAVYLDGLAFHASAQHFRVDGDIEKRNRLLNSEDNILPWNLTDADLDWFERERTQGQEFPLWYNGKSQQQAAQLPNLSDADIKLMAMSPMEQLIRLLEDPDNSRWEHLSTALSFHLLAHAKKKLGPASIWSALNEHVTATINVEGGIPRTKQLELRTAERNVPAELWNAYLSMANICWLTNGAVDVITASGPIYFEALPREDQAGVPVNYASSPASTPVPENVDGGEASIADVEDLPDSGSPQRTDSDSTNTPMDGAWASVFEEFDGEDDVIEVLTLLQQANVVAPSDLGEDFHDLATVGRWADKKIVLVFEEPETQIPEWTVLAVDNMTSTSDIPTELMEA